MHSSGRIEDLLAIMAALRDPGTGCPWDLKQSFSTITSYTIEEAYEVADAAERGDMKALRDELGDLLLQVVFYAQMAKEKNEFDFSKVVESISSKLIRRHPHIFAGGSADTADKVKTVWEEIKRAEKDEKENLLDDIPLAMPALHRAIKLQEKASTVDFDWNDPHAVLAKIREELDEFEEELPGGNKAREKDELGDILFALVNLARHRKIDPEQALRDANAKFSRRFSTIEKNLKDRGRKLETATLAEMEALWAKAKAEEKNQLPFTPAKAGAQL